MVWIQRGDPGPKCGQVFVISVRFVVQTGWAGRERPEGEVSGVRVCAAAGGGVMGWESLRGL